mmetsp:Transcript_64771/g.180248  ORF Transcript_64771/g.180248 Transcript_64771/m.180248 type:complete len:200 (-) Transcript_64771:584-1183(-)
MGSTGATTRRGLILPQGNRGNSMPATTRGYRTPPGGHWAHPWRGHSTSAPPGNERCHADDLPGAPRRSSKPPIARARTGTATRRDHLVDPRRACHLRSTLVHQFHWRQFPPPYSRLVSWPPYPQQRFPHLTSWPQSVSPPRSRQISPPATLWKASHIRNQTPLMFRCRLQKAGSHRRPPLRPTSHRLVRPSRPPTPSSS